MGSDGGLFDAASGVIAANRMKKAAAQTKKDSTKLRQQGLDYVSGLDWEPELLSDHVPTYQRSQSPVADAFLESLLTGQNPSAIQGTRNGADRLKAGAQRGFDQTYGGFDALRARQREMEASTPWQGKPFTTPAISEQSKWQVGAPGLARHGITEQQNQALRGAGVELDPVSAENTKFGQITAGGKSIWGTEIGPEEYKRLADAVTAGDRDLYQRILKGEA